MAIFNPGKYYLVSVDEEQGVCCVSPFNVTTIHQSYDDVHLFSPGLIGGTRTTVEGELYGTMNIIKAKDINNISYEEIMEIMKE